MKRLLNWLIWLVPALMGPMHLALAQTNADFTQGVAPIGSNALVWFKPTSATTTWVDVHYRLNNGPQQNFRMMLNTGAMRYEQSVANAAAGSSTISYSFTYNKGAPAYDSSWFTYLGGSSSGNTSTPPPTTSTPPPPTSSALSFTQGTSASGSTATLWFKPSQPISWVDVHYTAGSSPQQNVRMSFNASTARYEKAVTVSPGQTINHWFTYSVNGTVATNTAAVNGTGTATTASVAAPAFSPGAGTYNAAQTISLSTTTAGATIRYTLDGSNPTTASPVYAGSFLLSASKTVKALATKAGFADSPVSSAPYAISSPGAWNGLTTIQVLNATGGKWTDSQVYWAIIGRDPATGKFVHVDAAGRFIPMTLADNGPLSRDGVTYSNYFYSLAQARAVTIGAIDSARLLMSVGNPMYIRVVADPAGRIAYAGANIENPTDPNRDVIFDFGEFAILPKGKPSQGIFVNTTRVDHFGFPLQLRVQGLNGYDQTVGETLSDSRDSIFSGFSASVPAAFQGLAQSPYSPHRIIAPAHANFAPGKANANYLQPYIDQVWARFRNQDLVVKLDNLGTFTGRISGDVLRFTGGAMGGTYYVNGKPTTAMVMLGNGLLNDPKGASDVGTQLQLQAQLCAALNRGVAEDPSNWHNPAAFYPAGVLANEYAKFWHSRSLNKLAYGFAYDDVGNQSPSLHTDSPTTVTFTIGWGQSGPALAVPAGVAPTVAITDNVTGASANGPVTFTFKFSQDVGTSFTASDIIVKGGTKGTFTRISGTLATLVVTPDPAVNGNLTVSIGASSVTDAANRPNTAVASATRPYTPTTSPSNTWTLSWSDEFNGTALDTSVWSYDTGAGGWGNGESQNYQPQNVVVKDGFLTITAKREAVAGAAYTSARIQTSRKKTFLYGRFEMRAKLPTGQGMWPAFWLLGASCNSFGLYGGNLSWPRCGEIDAMEMVGGLADGSGDFTTHGTLHYLNAAGVNPMPGFAYRNQARLSDDFHVYTVDWTPQGFTWYIDGVAFGSKPMAGDMAAFQQPFFILLNLAVGGNWGGWPNASTSFPQTYVIDYVRQYTRAW